MKTGLLVLLLVGAIAANGWLMASRHLKAAMPAVTEHASSELPGPSLASQFLHVQLSDLSARLKMAGLPPHLARAYMEEEIEEQYLPREKEIRGESKPVKFWQTAEPLSVERRAALLALKREKSKLRLRLLGPDPIDLAESDHPFSPEKRAAVRRLVEDYAEAGKELRILGNRDNFLAAERAQRATFEAERESELTELLNPAELGEYYVRYTDGARYTRYDLSGMAPTEDEFRAVIAAQRSVEATARMTEKPVKEWFDLVNREDLRTQVEQELQRTLGEERFADYKRSRDFDYRAMAQPAARAGASPEAVKQAWDLRLTATSESRQIADAPALSDEQKGLALQALAARTREKMGGLLTPEAAAAYLQSPGATWFAYLSEGWAVTIRDRGMQMSPVSPDAKAKANARRKNARPGR